MNANQILGNLNTVCRFAALVLAIAALAKMSGFVQIRYGTMELAVVGILCALVSR